MTTFLFPELRYYYTVAILVAVPASGYYYPTHRDCKPARSANMTAGVVRCLVKAATVETTVAAVEDMRKVGARSWVLQTIIVAFKR